MAQTVKTSEQRVLDYHSPGRPLLNREHEAAIDYRPAR